MRGQKRVALTLTLKQHAPLTSLVEDHYRRMLIILKRRVHNESRDETTKALKLGDCLGHRLNPESTRYLILTPRFRRRYASALSFNRLNSLPMSIDEPWHSRAYLNTAISSHKGIENKTTIAQKQ